jgi:hypothetical protein
VACLSSASVRPCECAVPPGIVPDGQSSDNGAAIARNHGGIVLENGGLKIGHARDIGFSLAHGELIAFTDADCIVDAGWLANAIPYFADPKVGAVGGPSPVPGGQGPIAEAIGYFFRAATGVAGAAHVEEQFGVEEVRHLPGCNLVCRHEALQQIFPLQWEETSGEDLQLGRLLLQRIIDYSRSRGTAELRGETLAGNLRMQGLANSLGFKLQAGADMGSIDLRLPLREARRT